MKKHSLLIKQILSGVFCVALLACTQAKQDDAPLYDETLDALPTVNPIVCDGSNGTACPCVKADGSFCDNPLSANVDPNKCPSGNCNPAETPMEREILCSGRTVKANPVRVNLETPARCQYSINPKELISNIAVDFSSFKLKRLGQTSALPRFEVNGYSFEDRPLDYALQKLVSEADIEVVTDGTSFPMISASDVRGELSAVIDELAEAGDAYARYNSRKKRLILSNMEKFELSVPGGRPVLYAVLDALRGAGITNAQADFKENSIYLTIDKKMERTITKLVDLLKEDPKLLLLDINVYRLTKNCPINWQKVIQTYGLSKFNTTVNGLVGRALITDHQHNGEKFIDALKEITTVEKVSEGVAIMPNNWRVRFDIGSCMAGNAPERDLSMLFNSTIVSDRRLETTVTLDTLCGELTSFTTMYNIGDDFNVVGIPGTIFDKTWEDVEYVITMEPRVLRLIEEGNK